MSAAAPQPRVARPPDHEHLTALVRETVADVTGVKPELYAPGKHLLTVDGLELSVITTEQTFPNVRFDHLVLEVAAEMRSQAIDFANALHGRSSTAGAHWWLGDGCLWQVGHFPALKFDGEIFADYLLTFISIAKDRTPEIRFRLDTSVVDNL